MSDLIRRDGVLTVLKLESLLSKMSHTYAWMYIDMAIDRIKKAPAVDAVEVVRCKDCDFQREPGPFALNDIYCNLHRTYFPNNGFCHSGERRKENDKTN